MRHAFRFPDHIKEAVRAHVRRAVNSVDPRRFRQEPAYTAALIHGLEGIAYEDDDGFVSIRATNADSIGPGTAESWSGADFAITATVRQGASSIEKAILVQAKLGGLNELSKDERERLVGQVRDMSNYTRSPKVMVVPIVDGIRQPRMLSGRRILAGKSPRGFALPEYVVARITTTLDGDTRPKFVNGVQESTFGQLRIHAETRGPRVLVPVPERVIVPA
jgi:hypothetical protein